MKDYVSCTAILLLTGVATTIPADEYLSGIKWQKPRIVKPATAAGPPSDAVILFNGKDVSAWKNAEGWKIENGTLVTGRGDIRTKASFGDCQLHIEWSAPLPVKGKSQARGNSGVFLMDRYEIQVLDSFDNETYFDGQAGAIYKQTPPQVNAMRPPGQWNVYDIIWTAPRFAADGSLRSPAHMTALHNGILILNHFPLKGDTPFTRPPEYKRHREKLPIRLQDHGNPVRFRNIWIREIGAAKGKQVRAPFLRDPKGKERPIQRKQPAGAGRGK